MIFLFQSHHIEFKQHSSQPSALENIADMGCLSKIVPFIEIYHPLSLSCNTLYNKYFHICNLEY